MKKQFAIRALKRIKEMHETHRKLKALGVDLTDYEFGINLLEEAIWLLFSEDENDLCILQWWLYEDMDKILTRPDGSTIDVITAEDFIDWFAPKNTKTE